MEKLLHILQAGVNAGMARLQKGKGRARSAPKALCFSGIHRCRKYSKSIAFAVALAFGLYMASPDDDTNVPNETHYIRPQAKGFTRCSTDALSPLDDDFIASANLDTGILPPHDGRVELVIPAVIVLSLELTKTQSIPAIPPRSHYIARAPPLV